MIRMMPMINIINHIGSDIFITLELKDPLDKAKPTARGIKSIKISKNPIIENWPIVTFPSKNENNKIA